ncbi:hypothetical protein C5C74_16940, partial [Rathayibacter sp. AY1E8]|uniref:hypothetical protein n=1 Tax=Rathayibacter sp. AY1E8 TaxID=2080555 RepID=UPI000D48FD4C
HRPGEEHLEVTLWADPARGGYAKLVTAGGVLRDESAGLRAALDELSASVAADRASSEAAGATAAEQAADTAAALDERVRGVELELRAVTRRLAEALDR